MKKEYSLCVHISQMMGKPKKYYCEECYYDDDKQTLDLYNEESQRMGHFERVTSFYVEES